MTAQIARDSFVRAVTIANDSLGMTEAGPPATDQLPWGYVTDPSEEGSAGWRIYAQGAMSYSGINIAAVEFANQAEHVEARVGGLPGRVQGAMGVGLFPELSPQGLYTGYYLNVYSYITAGTGAFASLVSGAGGGPLTLREYYRPEIVPGVVLGLTVTGARGATTIKVSFNGVEVDSFADATDVPLNSKAGIYTEGAGPPNTFQGPTGFKDFQARSVLSAALVDAPPFRRPRRLDGRVGPRVIGFE